MAHTALVLLLQLAAGLLGWWWQSWPGAFVGAVVAGCGAALWQATQGKRFLRWVKEPQGGAPRELRGQWGDAGYRTARALRAEQDATRVADADRRCARRRIGHDSSRNVGKTTGGGIA